MTLSKYDEARTAALGQTGGTFYAEDLVTARENQRLRRNAEKVIRAKDQVWEDCPHGRIRHVAHPKLSHHVQDIEIYMQELPPDGRSGKHRHMAEEFMFILEGRGYSLHWDAEMEIREAFQWSNSPTPRRFDWEAGDWVYVPVGTAHQHFNSDGDGVARFLSASSRVFKALGWHDLEELEDAPRER
jgi:quercetin dioxygenase-like cupin family protein